MLRHRDMKIHTGRGVKRPCNLNFDNRWVSGQLHAPASLPMGSKPTLLIQEDIVCFYSRSECGGEK